MSTSTDQPEKLQILPGAPSLAELRGLPTFASLSDAELSTLPGMRMVGVDAGVVLFSQGEIAQAFWILLQGSLQLFHVSTAGEEEPIYVYQPGAAFGEVPLLANLPSTTGMRTLEPSRLLQWDESSFWQLMTNFPGVRKSILGNMAFRLQKLQSGLVQQEKMATLGTLAAGLMHELNNPGVAARRAASSLRENLTRLHDLTARFNRTCFSEQQRSCICSLQERALSSQFGGSGNSLEQSDAEATLAEWMEGADVDEAWKLAPVLSDAGIEIGDLECARQELSRDCFADALRWLDALVSSMQLVKTIEESIGRVSDLVHAVKSYAYEGKGHRQTLDINDSIHATLVILAHKIREKQITVEKHLAPDLPLLHSDRSGLNQIWTNLLDNAIDAVEPASGRIRIETWAEGTETGAPTLCVRISDNGAGIAPEVQEHVFEPFFTTKELGVGTGLGLSIVERLVEQYRGQVKLRSVPGETEFTVRLPSAHP